MAAEVILRALRLSVVLLAVCVSLSSNREEGDVGSLVVTILSQADGYHSARAREKKENWLEKLSILDQQIQAVLLAHELPVRVTWTVVPLLPHLAEHYPEASWFFFANEETVVDFELLRTALKRFDDTKVWFLGHGLQDQKRTIIHHYMYHTGTESISYPNFASGWLLSGPALKRAAENVALFAPDFNIDPPFELALFLKYMRTLDVQETIAIPPIGDSGGYLLTHVPQLCMEPALTQGCATAYSHHIPSCGDVEVSKLFIGVKTCEKYHSTRLPVVQGTWARDAEGSVAYYSEVEDKQFLTTDIGVPNTESGHCGKMMAIIERFQAIPELRGREWLVIADDDTLLRYS
ncbi:Beta-1,3-glucosyltransferase [Geodia barretti]|uniref:Beta-1,3-glucosyltransferase n=1 Tax=Geodia barretti TaxID=519541 RepID=A0AA35SCZ1_GEOBA|nr:Beta-1,3-glucosyltransferase [Geodia barretti]